MAKSGPFIVVEDDRDDQEIMLEIIKGVGVPNQLILFNRCKPAFSYLKTTLEQPFLILCDINLPQQSGLDFKKQIDADPQLRQRSIPFIFFSTSDDPRTVTEAYTKMTVQGFFKKEAKLAALNETIKIITDYWKLCLHPNTTN